MTSQSTLALLDRIAASTEAAPIVRTSTETAVAVADVEDHTDRAHRFHTSRAVGR